MKLFSEQEIFDIYNKHVNKSDDYYKKWEKLPLELNNKRFRWEGNDFPRVWSVLDFREWVVKHNIPKIKKVLATGLDDPELEFLEWDKLYYAPYHQGQNDLHTLDLEIKDFDFVMVNQTLEHLYNPFISVQNLYNHMADGGYLYTSVPTINIPHMTPIHFNGLTPMGLAMLMASVGFEILEVGFWGNMDYINYIFENQWWPGYEKLIKDGIITNEKDRNAQCWILVKK